MFGGLLASAIAKMDGARGLANWRWIFILEGIFTILVGIFAYFTISDFPDEARWLTEVERKYVIARTATKERDTGTTLRSAATFLTSPNNILGGIIYFCKPSTRHKASRHGRLTELLQPRWYRYTVSRASRALTFRLSLTEGPII